MKLRQVEIIIPEYKLSVDIPIVISKHRKIYEFAYILHDHNCVCPHYHIYLKCFPAIESLEIEEWFQVSFSSQCNFVRCNDANMLLYLLQWQGTGSQTYEYPLENLQTSFNVSSLIKLNRNAK